MSPASSRTVSLALVVMTRHCAIHPLLQLLIGEVHRLIANMIMIAHCNVILSYLTGDIAVAGHVAIAIVLDVAVNKLTQRSEGGHIGVWLPINHRNLLQN